MAKLIITIMTVALLMGADRTIRNVLMSVTHFFSADYMTSKERSHFGHRQI